VNVSSAQPPLPPVIDPRPYWLRWVYDRALFKGAVKSARTGFSFGSAVEAYFDCLEHPGTTWVCLSHSDRGSVEFLEEGVGKIKTATQGTAELYKESYADELGRTDLTAHRCDFPNGSRIIALPSNPRTARGYPGHAILDEFAFHENSYAIWAAVTRQVALGHKLRVVSTPGGEQGKYYDLAREFGLTDGVAPAQNPLQQGKWSWHWVDVTMAIADGCPVNLADLQDLYRGDPDTLRQEFYCVFLKAVGAWLDLALVSAAEDDGATMELPQPFTPRGFLSLGVDFGRSGDRTCYWLDEYIGDVSWTRALGWIHNMPFFAPDNKDQIHALNPFVALADRVAMDSTGIGLGAYEWFNAHYPGKIMGINFGGSVKRLPQGDQANARGLAESIKIKTDMAVRMKQRMERRLNRIPHNMDARAELLAIKRESGEGGAVKFDAPRIEVDTPSGMKQKAYSHAEAFWAKAMADLAAAQPMSNFAQHAYSTGEPVVTGMDEVFV
jgi:phage FluMu gp28-like protein